MKSWVLGFLVLMMGVLKASDAPEVHPYHVGSVEITYSQESQTYQITAKFFLDDLENALNQHQTNPIYFDKPDQKIRMYQVLERYMKAHLVIKNNANPIHLNFLGYEVEKESVFIYLESVECPTPTSVTVGLNVLYDLFDDQMNIVHLKVNGKRKSHKLDYPEIYFTEKW